MRLTKGAIAPEFSMIDYKGDDISLAEFKGKKLMLSFFRYAACPFCNLRIHKMIQQYPLLQEKGLYIIAVFQSPSGSIQKFVGNQSVPFPIIPDPAMSLYQSYRVETSGWSLVKMMFRLKDLAGSVKKGFFKLYPEGPMHRVPADFLINEKGTIDIAYYGKDSGDHLAFDRIQQWLKK